MRIFRIQRESDGWGPYGENSPLAQFPRLFNLSRRHPDPWSDYAFEPWQYAPKLNRKEWFFAFASVDAAIDWFIEPEWREALRAGGFTLTEWEVDPLFVMLGDRQALFLKSKATLIASHPIPE